MKCLSEIRKLPVEEQEKALKGYLHFHAGNPTKQARRARRMLDKLVPGTPGARERKKATK